MGLPRPGQGMEAPDIGKGVGSFVGLCRSPRALAQCMGCRRGRRLEMWHSKGWGHAPTGQHISGTELPRPSPGSGPFTAHQLPRLLPEAGGESGRTFPMQQPENCRRGLCDEPPAPHWPGPASIILAATWDPRTSYLSCSYVRYFSSTTHNQIDTAICSNLL